MMLIASCCAWRERSLTKWYSSSVHWINNIVVFILNLIDVWWRGYMYLSWSKVVLSGDLHTCMYMQLIEMFITSMSTLTLIRIEKLTHFLQVSLCWLSDPWTLASLKMHGLKCKDKDKKMLCSLFHRNQNI